MMKKKVVYVEPEDYFPKELRKKHGLGEYAKTEKPPERERYIENCGGIKFPPVEPPQINEKDKDEK